MNVNWKAIKFAILVLILFACYIFTHELLPGNILRTVTQIGLASMILANIIALINAVNPEFNHTKTEKFFSIFGSILLMLATIVFLFPNTFSSITSQTFVPGATTKPEVFSLGKLGNLKDVDQKASVMVTRVEVVHYTQSGENNAKTLHGIITEGQALVLDAYTLEKVINSKYKTYTGGNLYVITGPLNLDKNPITYVDGCAQLIDTSQIQAFLDNNIAVKFARGDWNKMRNCWSYKPWALTNFWLPDGIKYNKITLNSTTDTYPNKDIDTTPATTK